MIMEELISIINKLQDVFASMGEEQISINLPQIVVVGSQSSGKSSVLESIVGREFLPRGDGLCTRRPLILQLYHVSANVEYSESNTKASNKRGNRLNNVNSQESTESVDSLYSASDSSNTLTEWAEFLHKPGEKFTDFNKVREEILKDTERISGNNSGISEIPIRLKLFSPHVLTLTLIDLPGMTKNPVGDQPIDIEQKVRDVCMKYCNNSRAIILPVTAANTDLANSDGLNIAKKCDPSGERTLGVITKLDLMDQGTDASEILSNKLIPLRLGYIGVINRSQLEIKNKTSVQDHRKKEEDFFKKHPEYDSSKMGTQYLTSELSKLLYKHIRKSLPGLRNDINSKMLNVDTDLQTVGVSPFDELSNAYFNDDNQRVEGSESQMSEVMLNIITSYAKKFSNAIEGKFDIEDSIDLNFINVSNLNATGKGSDQAEEVMCGGAKILSLFHGSYHSELAAISPLHNLSDQELRRTILSTMGTRKALFVPENSFDMLVSRQIGYFMLPSVQCAQRVFDELCTLTKRVQARALQRYPTLRARISDVVVNLLRKQLKPTIKMIEDIISIEKAYINRSHPDFLGGPDAIKRAYNNSNRRGPAVVPGTVGLAGTRNASDTAFEERSSLDVNGDFDEPAPSYEKERAQGENKVLSFLFNNSKAQSEPVPAANDFETDSGRNAEFEEAYEAPRPVNPMVYEDQTLNEMDCEIIKELMKSYLEISRKNIEDLIPKTIMFFLVNYIRDTVQNELVREVYNNRNDYSLYLREDPEIAERREKLRKMKKYLLKALDVLSQVDDFRFKVGSS